jgi:hypothetical protein
MAEIESKASLDYDTRMDLWTKFIKPAKNWEDEVDGKIDWDAWDATLVKAGFPPDNTKERLQKLEEQQLPTEQTVAQPTTQPAADEMLREQVVKYSNIISKSNRLRINFTPLPGFFEEIISSGDKLSVRRYTPNPKDRSLFNLIPTQGTVSSIDKAAGTVTIDFETKSGVKTLTYKYKDLISAITDKLPESTTDKSYIYRMLRIDEIQKAEKSVATTRKLKAAESVSSLILPVGKLVTVNRYVPASRDSADVKLVRSDGKIVSKDANSFTAEFTLPTGKTMNLTFQYSAIVDNSVQLPKTSPTKNDQFNKVQILRTTGGNEFADPYYLKYLKYKAKYLKLKDSF